MTQAVIIVVALAGWLGTARVLANNFEFDEDAVTNGAFWIVWPVWIACAIVVSPVLGLAYLIGRKKK